ncbi:hypothetical protein GDO78_009179 [Eleutherodactylus coqui]|uniref:Acyl-CoA-binding domain-containing protein 6 n=1 Tax=Eleutherodactylus coqui TaxID=57060 RepID=A0A8J6K8J8_ELECQ|nr:hypothetical protein GDO78_009179 [Eleutherodactylus coqui]
MASPEVFEESSSGEACSGGYGELGDFLLEERADEEEDDELRRHFEQAAQHAQNLAHVATTQQLLYLYARYKQASEEPVEKHKTTFGGPVVSCLYKVQETLSVLAFTMQDKEQNIFIAWVVRNAGRSLLHWACDRGRTELVSLLLFHNAHINMQDAEGQTPLHYASACEFTDIVDMLLDHGADPSLVDNDGFQPYEVTDSKEISDMLKQHASFGEHDKPPSLLQSAK